MSSTICTKCGGKKKPGFDLCFNCSQTQRGGGYGAKSGSDDALPKDLVFESFYGKDGFLRREIFLEAAEKAARLFEEKNITQTSLRGLFQMLKAVEQRIRTDKDLKDGEINETFMRFIRQVDYQTKREIIKTPIFKDFVNEHQEIVLKSREEFKVLSNISPALWQE